MKIGYLVSGLLVLSLAQAQGSKSREVAEEPAALPIAESSTRQATGDDHQKLWTGAAVGVSNLHTFANDRNVSLPTADDAASKGVIKCIIDAKSSACFDNWPLSQQAFAWMQELGAAIRGAKSTGDSLLGVTADDLIPVWSDIRDIYCRENPGAPYMNLENGITSCAVGFVKN